MDKITLIDTFRKDRRVVSEVVGFVESLPQDILDAMWDRAVKQSEQNGRKLENRERYFYDFAEGNILYLRSGTYKDFIAALTAVNDSRQSYGTLSKEHEKALNVPSLKTIGLQTALVTADDFLVFGKRSSKVQQARGLLCLPSGGIMPDYYPIMQRGTPDLYLAAHRQIKDETGKDIDPNKLHLIGVVSDSRDSQNHSLIFEGRVEDDKTGVLQGFDQATDRYEHDHLHFEKKEEVLDRLHHGKELPLVGSTIGALLLFGSSKGAEWIKEARSNIANWGFEVVDRVRT